MAKRKTTIPTPKKAITQSRAWKPLFLEALTITGNVTLAIRAAGVDKSTAYDHRKSDRKFRRAWKDSLVEAADLLEAEARRRGEVGVDEPVYYQGVKCGVVRKYSDTLLIFLLKAVRPKKFRENVKHVHSGPNDKPIQVETIRPAMARLMGDPSAYANAKALAKALTAAPKPAPDADASSTEG